MYVGRCLEVKLGRTRLVTVEESVGISSSCIVISRGADADAELLLSTQEVGDVKVLRFKVRSAAK